MFEKAKVSPKRHLKEFRLDDISAYNPGDEIKVEDMFQSGDKVDITGISKGKGFAGTTKRYGTARGPMSHGSGYHRGIGSMGQFRIQAVFSRAKMPGTWELKE